MTKVRSAHAHVAVVAALAAVLATVIAPAGAAQRGDGLAALCDRPTYVTGLGMACPTGDGLYQIMFEDGTVSWSHGPDYFNPMWASTAAAFGDTLRAPVCVKDPRSQYHHKALYVYPFDQPNRYGQTLGEIRRMVRMINGFLYEESNIFDRPLQYRAACTPQGQISVDVVELRLSKDRRDTIPGIQDYISIVNEVRRAGFTNPFAKYWIYYDGPYNLGAGLLGIASGAIGDDRLVAENWNNYGPGYGVYYGVQGELGAMVMMHEDAHTMGAVAVTSPNSTRGFHCIDGADVMCYDDGGARADLYKGNVCKRVRFDCNKNDYFNPKPKAGSFLATHWNLGSPLNRFFQGCLYRTGEITGAGGPEVGATIAENAEAFGDVALRSFSIKKKCRGRIYALSGVLSPQPAAADGAVGLTPHTQLPFGFVVGDMVLGTLPTPDGAVSEAARPDFDVCFYDGSRLIRCDTEIGTDQGKVPPKATRAVIGAKGSVGGIYVFSAI